MKIALIGATGNVGRRILAEAGERGHRVTAIARHADKLEPREGVEALAADLNDPEAMKQALAGHEAVVLSVRFQGLDFEKMLDTMKRARVPRLLIVGGAASLEVAPGEVLLDQPDFPEFIKPEATPARAALERLREEEDLDWTFLSPAIMFEAGERTGKFRLGKDQVLTAEDGKSHISYEDYAVALLDEIEKPRHHRERFTVGY